MGCVLLTHSRTSTQRSYQLNVYCRKYSLMWKYDKTIVFAVLVFQRCFCYMSVAKKDTKPKDEHEVDPDVSAATAAGSGSSCDGKWSLSSSDVIQEVKDHTERAGEVCVGHGKRDDIIDFTRRLFTQLHTWRLLYWLQHQGLNHLRCVQL